MRALPLCLIAGFCLLLLAVMPLIPRGEQSIQRLDPFNTQADTVLAYFGFPGCQTACPKALAEMTALEGTLSPEQLRRLDRVFVNIDPHSDVDRLEQWLGGYQGAIRAHQPSPEERHFIERNLGLRLYPTPDQPLHANVFVLLQQEAPDQWRVRTSHRELPLTQIHSALAH